MNVLCACEESQGQNTKAGGIPPPAKYFRKFQENMLTNTRNACIIISVGRVIPRNTEERRPAMARQKKNGNQNTGLQVVVLITAILNLIHAVIDLIDH